MVEPTTFPRQGPTPEEHVRKQGADAELLGRISKNVNNIAASLRILEERYSTLRNKTQVSEQNIIDLEKDVTSDIRLLSDDSVDLKRDIKDVKDKLRLISAEMKNLVKKHEFRVIDRYLDMWQPMNFVTKNELNRLIEEKQKEKENQRETEREKEKEKIKEVEEREESAVKEEQHPTT